MSAPPELDPAAGATTTPLPSGWQRVRAALTVLRERGWALGLVAVLVLSVVFVLLAQWQFGRHESKVVRNEHIDENYDAPPSPLSDVLASTAVPLPADRTWRPVRVSGVYDAAATRLIRNRPLDGVFGYDVVVPLRLSDGGTLLIDRGWIPNGRTGAQPDSVPPPPPGPVTVVARLRPSEPGVDRQPPPGQELRIDVPRIAAAVGGEVYQAYGVLAAEEPRPAGAAPALLPRPDEDLGPHLSYGIQWWGFTVAAFVVYGYYLDAEARRRAGGPPARPLTERLAARRRRRRGPSDEEWEDASA